MKLQRIIGEILPFVVFVWGSDKVNNLLSWSAWFWIILFAVAMVIHDQEHKP